jgi:hypothetical protein
MVAKSFSDAMRFGEIIASEDLKKRQRKNVKTAKKAKTANDNAEEQRDDLHDKLKKAKKAVAKIRKEIHDQLQYTSVFHHRADQLDPSRYYQADTLIQEAITMLHQATQIRGRMNQYITNRYGDEEEPLTIFD